MNLSQHRLFQIVSFLTLAAFLLALSGCDYLSFYSRQRTWRALYESQPRMSLVQRFAPQDSLLVSGSILDVDPVLAGAVTSIEAWPMSSLRSNTPFPFRSAKTKNP